MVFVIMDKREDRYKALINVTKKKGRGKVNRGGQLQLNAFEPIIFYSLERSLSHLTAGCSTLEKNCVRGITANRERLRAQVERSIGVVTALNPFIGYQHATEVAIEAHRSGEGVHDVILRRGLMTREHLDHVLSPELLTRPFGSSSDATVTEERQPSVSCDKET